ncbi:MAG: hypothetical protein EP347_05985 [Alphaproteobacteria bacterium]|nr:MAG: hypothetical protein EP347_05985 [Alphaproteobacteria bacterium]
MRLVPVMVSPRGKYFRSRLWLLDPAILSCVVGLCLVGLRLHAQPDLLAGFRSETLHSYTLTMSFDEDTDDVAVRTYLPLSDAHQDVVREHVISGSFSFDDTENGDGRLGVWSGRGESKLSYHALVASKRVTYQLDPNLRISRQLPEEVTAYLMGTEAIPVFHKEIDQVWSQIGSGQDRLLLPTLQTIYRYVYEEIEGAPFKGFTDALTALRLKQASCNGKGRLFVALARYNGIPARLVGGVILNNGRKKTSHQWVEVWVQDHWVPIDPTNGHFATLPANYLQLYTGDLPLFTHTKNINFEYLFDIEKEHLSSALFRFGEADEEPSPSRMNAAELLAFTGLDERTIGVFLLFPFGALVVAFLRNVIGLHTFGTFMPMLVAAACVHTGLVEGLSAFGAVVLFAFLGHAFLDRYRLLKVPRLAAIITLCTGLFIVVLWSLGGKVSWNFGMLALFPVIIISFLADRIHQMAEDRNWRELFISSVGVLISTTICFFAFSSVVLQSVFSLMPETLFLVLAVLIYFGRWPGMRLLEYIRFRNILGDGSALGINSRNRDYVNLVNPRIFLELATDKVRTKEALATAHIPVCDTLAICANHHDLDDFLAVIRELDRFVLKPNRGTQGNGILVIRGQEDGSFIAANGDHLTLKDIERHTLHVLSGTYSQDSRPDAAYVEPLLEQHHALNRLADLGLSDIRVILFRGKPISAMLRLPTSQSNCKANLHQGAIGIAIDLKTGATRRASIKGREIKTHPDSNASLEGFVVPYWDQIVDIAIACGKAIPLGYLGVDICLDDHDGPIVLEVNGRPGIEIQNVQKKGLRRDLEFHLQTS